MTEEGDAGGDAIEESAPANKEDKKIKDIKKVVKEAKEIEKVIKEMKELEK
ncbi:MAG: hypothetical protein ACR5KX_01230 [Wolbachia sp.]